MGRRKKNFDKMPAGFDAGTFDQMDELLFDGETRKEFLRAAVAREFAWRKKHKPQKPRKKSDNQSS